MLKFGFDRRIMRACFQHCSRGYKNLLSFSLPRSPGVIYAFLSSVFQLHNNVNRGLGPVCRKSRNFSGVFRVT